MFKKDVCLLFIGGIQPVVIDVRDGTVVITCLVHLSLSTFQVCVWNVLLWSRVEHR